MGHLPDLIHDLALILITGALALLLFRRIKQPIVLGYIIAGFLIGPYFHLFPTVADNANIKILAEIGVIFLLFSLGLEFSFKKLMQVGAAASITALFEIVFITIAGYFTGKLMGWSTMDSLFLGGMLASSSTTIIIKAFDELGVKTKQFARVVFGVLIVEDIVVILLMVLLSTIAVTEHFEGREIIFTVLKLLFFLILWFISGIFLLPTLFKKAKSFLDEETLLILSLGLCLGMVVLATEVGFSAELGAFIMGSIIAETTLAEKVEHLTKSVKDLFGAIFFVSIGMLIDPQSIIKYAVPILIVTSLTMFGKLFSTTAGALLSGQPLKQSVQAGMSMAQIGEFAFIVATLGLSLGVTSDFLFPVAVGASAITTFTTPYLIRYSEPFYLFLERHLPKRWIKRLGQYSLNAQNIQAQNDWKRVLLAYSKIVVINGILIISVILLSAKFLIPFLKQHIDSVIVRNIFATIIPLAVASPFFFALLARKPATMAYKSLWLKKSYRRGPLLIIEILRLLIGIFLIGFLESQAFDSLTAIIIAVPLAVAILLIFSSKLQHIYLHFEERFLRNLNARERAGDEPLSANVRQIDNNIQSELLPWDAHIVQLTVPQKAVYIGRSLQELGWREKYGINIGYIRRGDTVLHIPGGKDIILPLDNLGIIATDEQIQVFKPVMDTEEAPIVDSKDSDAIVVDKVVVNEFTKLKGLDIRSSGIREKTNGLVIGIERINQRILNPDSKTVFEWDDVVWIVGDREKIILLKKSGIDK
ncbi:MAG: sodium:proton antiporter [Bacteroidetes bacterium]|nr:MAG: sodium:proton antiporter [Bacteroidota bacterium]